MAKAANRKSSKPKMVSAQERSRIESHQALMRCSRREVAIQRLTRSLRRSIARSDAELRELHVALGVKFELEDVQIVAASASNA